MMSTVFDVPCPGCGRRMTVKGDGHLRCAGCQQAYQLRMGHLFPMQAAPASPRPAPAARPMTASPS